jgi:hypothetical protein
MASLGGGKRRDRGNSQAHYAKYEDGSVYRRHFLLKSFGRDLEESTPITAQMLSIIWHSKLLSWFEKSEAHISLFATLCCAPFEDRNTKAY